MKNESFNKNQDRNTIPTLSVEEVDISTESTPRAVKSRESSSPILVTGAHRSGTTWVGRILASAKGMAYIHEPFNCHWSRPGVRGAWCENWFKYLCEENGEEYFEYIESALRFHYVLQAELRVIRQTKSFRDVKSLARQCFLLILNRKRQLRAVVKDPVALMSSEWLERHFGMQIVVMIRHPAGFAYSLKKRGWRFNFRELLDQELLMRDMLEPFRDRMELALRSKADLMTEVGLLWSILNHVVSEYRKNHPGWIFIRHEDFATNPLPEFKKLFAKLGMPIGVKTERVIDSLTRSSGKQRPAGATHWLERDSRALTTDWVGKLTKREISQLRNEVEPVYYEFYDDTAWK
ncbi:MAG: sulfotransferase [Planctomycetes bacterium]|nr:sulfotransferase [Planctomycetota bacterium]